MKFIKFFWAWLRFMVLMWLTAYCFIAFSCWEYNPALFPSSARIAVSWVIGIFSVLFFNGYISYLKKPETNNYTDLDAD